MAQDVSDYEEFLNEEFARRLREEGGSMVDVLVETRVGDSNKVAEEIEDIGTARLTRTGVVSPEFVAIEVDSSRIRDVANLDSVVKVHQDQKVGVKREPFSAPTIPFLRPESNPFDVLFTEAVYEVFGDMDKYAGAVRISPIEVPVVNPSQLPPGNPAQTILSGVDQAFQVGFSGQEFVPTQRSVDWIMDSDLLNGNDGSDTKVAVVDTGYTPLAMKDGDRIPYLESMVPGEPPTDFQGHGTWCTNTVTGRPTDTAWGTCVGVAEGAQHAHFKALNTFPGFGRTSWILKAMDRAVEWGADVISMSLGGTQQGGLEDDPYCRFIRRRCKENLGREDGAIFVVAAGNSGPGQYEVGSPGTSEKALTVGSWSLTDESPSYFSSRGPQGDWYADRPDRFERDLEEYGADEFIKPDVVAPGGGRETEAKDGDARELLHQTCTGWMEGMYDGLKDGHGLTQGTSMATPHVAGLVVRLYDAGIIDTAADVKDVVASNSRVPEFPNAADNANSTYRGKNIAVGYGPIRESMFE